MFTPKKFVNKTKLRTEVPEYEHPLHGRYDYDSRTLTEYLITWSGLFQSVVSQAGTHLLTGAFHDGECGIYVSEGGAKIHGVGELTIHERYCSFGGHRHDDDDRNKRVDKLAKLISELVMRFDPMHPVDSLVETAANTLAHAKEGDLELGKKLKLELRAALEKSGAAGPFSGDPLWRFFAHIKSDHPDDRDAQRERLRPYRRYCMTVIGGKAEKDVDRLFAGEDTARKLEADLKEVLDRYSLVSISSPRYQQDPTQPPTFWVNSSVGYGHLTEKQIRTLIAKPIAELRRMKQEGFKLESL